MKGDLFVSFQANNLRDVDKQLVDFLNSKPRDIKHIQRGVMPGSKDIGYPKPAIDPDMPRPIMPGQDTMYIIDIIYRDVD